MDFKHINGMPGTLIAEGHGHDEDASRASLAQALSADRSSAQAQAHAGSARLSETWYCEGGGFGHDCAAHTDVDRRLWSPHCGQFRPVTVASAAAPDRVERVRAA